MKIRYPLILLLASLLLAFQNCSDSTPNVNDASNSSQVANPGSSPLNPAPQPPPPPPPPAQPSVKTIVTSYSVLVQQHPGCSSAAAALTGACNAAINRYCISTGFNGGGLGPVEMNGDALEVVCFSSDVATDVSASIDQLQQLQPTCAADAPTTVNCISAAHRFCIASGSTTGYGAVEYSGNTRLVACFSSSHATYMVQTWTELVSYHPGCTDASQARSGACSAAIHRDCVARGYVSGFGAIEFNGPSVGFACIK